MHHANAVTTKFNEFTMPDVKYITEETKDASIAKRFVADLNQLIQPMGMKAAWRKARSSAKNEDTEISVGNCQVLLQVGDDCLVVNMTIYKRGYAWVNIYVHEGGNEGLVVIANEVIQQFGMKTKYSNARNAIAFNEVTPLKAAAILESLYLFMPGLNT